MNRHINELLTIIENMNESMLTCTIEDSEGLTTRYAKLAKKVHRRGMHLLLISPSSSVRLSWWFLKMEDLEIIPKWVEFNGETKTWGVPIRVCLTSQH